MIDAIIAFFTEAHPLQIIGQAIGFFGTAMNILSFLQKKQRTIIIFQLFGSLLFTVHYLLLGLSQGVILVGFILNAIGILRGFVFSHMDWFKADHPAWMIGFISTYIAGYVLIFTVFGTEPTPYNFIAEIFPILGTSTLTISYRMKTAKRLRLLCLFNSAAWLTYNVMIFSLAGIVCEVFCVVSIIVGIIRWDLRKPPHPRNAEISAEEMEKINSKRH